MSSVADKLAQKSAVPSTKQVRLNLVRISLWSTLKVSFVVGLAIAVLSGIAVCLAWGVLTVIGVPQQINTLLGVTSSSGTSASVPTFGTGTMLGVAFLIGLLNFISVMILGTIFTLLYNAYARLTGGLLVGFTNS
ncbi:MAG: hypothetical protein JWQ39_457 [Glaciihabitans sp.]|nr:hypothetical protein [Glaciihabitans sp.]